MVVLMEGVHYETLVIRFLRDQSGATAIEYGLMMADISHAIAASRERGRALSSVRSSIQSADAPIFATRSPAHDNDNRPYRLSQLHRPSSQPAPPLTRRPRFPPSATGKCAGRGE
ncbi:Flp family type IVb pilin [Bradyrhizobium icense]|uniref:Flp family type IVb pilin n=1 Tax=Bradyrhizobium icense TaxID=1274631 RepID=UPI0009F683E3